MQFFSQAMPSYLHVSPKVAHQILQAAKANENGKDLVRNSDTRWTVPIGSTRNINKKHHNPHETPGIAAIWNPPCKSMRKNASYPVIILEICSGLPCGWTPPISGTVRGGIKSWPSWESANRSREIDRKLTLIAHYICLKSRALLDSDCARIPHHSSFCIRMIRMYLTYPCDHECISFPQQIQLQPTATEASRYFPTYNWTFDMLTCHFFPPECRCQ